MTKAKDDLNKKLKQKNNLIAEMKKKLKASEDKIEELSQENAKVLKENSKKIAHSANKIAKLCGDKDNIVLAAAAVAYFIIAGFLGCAASYIHNDKIALLELFHETEVTDNAKYVELINEKTDDEKASILNASLFGALSVATGAVALISARKDKKRYTLAETNVDDEINAVEV